MKKSVLFATLGIAGVAAAGLARTVKKHGGPAQSIDKLKQHPAVIGAAAGITALKQHPAIASRLDKFRKQPTPLPEPANNPDQATAEATAAA